MMYHRADLHQTLGERATSVDFPGRPVTLLLSSRVVSCDCEKGVAELENGDILTADLIVGADGIMSVIWTSAIGQNVVALPSGLSAYRMMIPTEELAQETDFVKVINPRKGCTTMVIGHDRRLIMGPARNGSIYGVVALVPDEDMTESSSHSNWNTVGDHEQMVRAFADFPLWAQKPLRLAKEVGLWQLRDLAPLPTWYRGRAILIGDAAHAMLPTQGQGASQAIEDAEALGAFFEGYEDRLATNASDSVTKVNKAIMECRYDRATTIQAYSRQAASTATDEGDLKIKMSPAEFMDYNCLYNGALDWKNRRMRTTTS